MGKSLREKAISKLASIIVPTYNRASLLPRALDSVWSQTYRPIELILVDDGSTDESQDVVERWANDHTGEGFTFKYIQKENTGPAPSRNAGIEAATGDFVYFLDSDDFMYKSLLEECIRILGREQSECVVFGFTFSKHGKAKGQFLPPTGLEALDAFLHGQLWGYTSCALSKMDLIRKTGLWSDKLKNGEDYEYLGRTLLTSKKTSVLTKPLFNVCRGEGSLGSVKDSNKGLRDRLSAERTISDLVKKNTEIADSTLTAYASRLLKTSINYHARNEAAFAKGLQELAFKIDRGPWTALQLARRFVSRNGKILCVAWVKSISIYAFLRRWLYSSAGSKSKNGELLSD